MDDVLPHNPTAWWEAVKHHKVAANWVDVQSSGSGLKLPDFLTLRTTWPREVKAAKQLDSTEWMSPNLKRRFGEAIQYLKNSKDWLGYLDSFDVRNSAGLGQSSVNLHGTYALVRYYQYLSTQKKKKDDTSWDVISPKVSMFTRSRYKPDPQTTPTRAGRPVEDDDVEELDGMLDDLELRNDSPQLPETPPSKASSSRSFLSPNTPLQSFGSREEEAVEDEQIINTALILFLNALTLHCPGVSDHWSLYRKPLTFCDARGAKVYEARVDGLLRSNDKMAKILVEVKPCYRCAGGDDDHTKPKGKIRMQETAQMVAWIYEAHKSHPRMARGNQNHTYRRLLVSQDQQEIFVTVATYDEIYVSYLYQQSSRESFLEMSDYGPFNVTDVKHMRHLGELMLAFSLNSGC